ncbi:MAG: type II toxin-antitoxin system prevent-host-death family antitoxin [Thermodesulfobacteriota bacterium]
MKAKTKGEKLRSGKVKLSRTKPQIILKDGEPKAVILDINEYQELLERLEDKQDIEMLQKMREKTLKFRKLDEFLAEYAPNV